MRKIILPIMVSFIILLSNIAYADISTKAKVNVTAVRIRESASTDSNIVTNIYEEDEVEVLDKNGDWYKVQYGNSVGYAKAEFFTITQEGDLLNLESESTNSTSNEVATQENTITDAESVPVAQAEVVEPNLNQEYTLLSTANLKIVPNLWAEEKINVPEGTVVTVNTQMGNWYKITDENLAGWITFQKLKEALNTVATVEEVPQETTPTEPEREETSTVSEEPEEEEEEETTQTSRTAIVTVETARVRNSASTSSDVIDTLDEDEIVTITGEEGDFYKITTSRIPSGYISKSLVREKGTTSRSSGERENTVSEEANESVNELLTTATSNAVTGEDVVAFAKQYLGYSYVSGGSTPESGFDCSGFTRYIFGHFGYSLGRTAADQTLVGSVIERADLQIGDLLLFYDDAKTKIGHCGIYIGNGEFIHSANPQRGVVTDNLNTNSYYNTRFVTARRIAGG